MKGYNTSKDYNLLWELIKNQYKIICIVTHKGEEITDDLAFMAPLLGGYNMYAFGSNFGAKTSCTKSDFIKHCEKWDVRFIPPITE